MTARKNSKGKSNFEEEEDLSLSYEKEHTGDDDDEDDFEDEVAEIDVLDLSGDSIQELLPYLEQCDREGRTLTDVISELWECVTE